MREIITKIVNNLTIKEKAKLLSGSTPWSTCSIEREKIKPIIVSDGPMGIRKVIKTFNQGEEDALEACLFPSPTLACCSFDKNLMYEYGKGLSIEAKEKGVNIVLGPAINIKRNPLNGRTFEYFSEDPVLTGEMAGYYIKGLEDNGVGACIKHFAVNSQETRRMVMDEIVDEYALREIYLKGFELAISIGKPTSLMTSYNLVNTEYSHENTKLHKILREEWGYNGLVISDWGGLNDLASSINAGSDLEMPSSKKRYKSYLRRIKNGSIDKDKLDESIERIVYTSEQFNKRKPEINYDRNSQKELVRTIARESIVLAKNDDKFMPLNKSENIVIIGDSAEHPYIRGGGSSRVNTQHINSFIDECKKQKISFKYCKGFDVWHDENVIEDELKNEVISNIQPDTKVLFFMSLNPLSYSEGIDAIKNQLPPNQISLLNEVLRITKKVAVILSTPSCVDLDFIDDIKSLFIVYLGGEEVGGSIFDLVFGDYSPSGKLAETWTKKIEYNPSYNYFLKDSNISWHKESFLIGYRYFIVSKSDQCLFPFGHGLSYTKFDYKILKTELIDFNSVMVEVAVKNIGDYDGKCVVQLYLEKPESCILKEKYCLLDFGKVFLKKGESQKLIFKIKKEKLYTFNIFEKGYVLENGSYKIKVNENAFVELDSSKFEIKDGSNPKFFDFDFKSYNKPSSPVLEINDEEFKVLLNGLKIPEVKNNKKGQYDLNTTIGDLRETFIGKIILSGYRKKIQNTIEISSIHISERNEMANIESLPLRNLIMSGFFTEKKALGFLHLFNGKIFKGLFNIIFG